MFIPIRTDSPLRSTPYMNWALIVANVLVWVAQNVVGQSPDPHAPLWWQHYMLNIGAPEMVNFLTYGFLHAGAMHLIGNMLFLYIFGNNVNDKMGHVGYLAFYLGGIVFSAVVYALWQKEGVVLGASGAVSAVVGAYLVLFPRASVTVFFWFILIGTFEIPSFWFVLAFFAKDVIGLSGVSDVAHAAHLGGFIFGFIVCIPLLALSLLPRDQFDAVALFRQWNRRRQYRDAVSAGWNPYVGNAPGRPSVNRGSIPTFREDPPAPEPLRDPRQLKIGELRGQIAEAIGRHDFPAAANLYIELKTYDPRNVLPRQSQLDVANQLANEQRYPHAVEAYETFLQAYPKYEQTEQVELMLGIILSRFMNQPAKAREYLLRASAKLMTENARQMARNELEKVNAALGASSGGPPPFPGAPSVGGAV